MNVMHLIHENGRSINIYLTLIVPVFMLAETAQAFTGDQYNFDTNAFADCVMAFVVPGAEVSTCCIPVPYVLTDSTNSALSGDSQQTSCSNVDPNCYFDFYFADNNIVNNAGPDFVYFEGYNQAAFQISVRNATSGEWTTYNDISENSFVQISCGGLYPTSCGPWSPSYGPGWPQYYRGLLLAYEIDLDTFSLPAGTRIDAVRYRSDDGGDPVMIGALHNQNEAVTTGDVNGDGKIDVIDVISALKTISNSQSACALGGSDISGDDKVGLEEAIHALQVTSELRIPPDNSFMSIKRTGIGEIISTEP